MVFRFGVAADGVDAGEGDGSHYGIAAGVALLVGREVVGLGESTTAYGTSVRFFT